MEVHHYKSLLNKVAETSSNNSIDFKNGISLYYEYWRCNPSKRKNLWKKTGWCITCRNKWKIIVTYILYGTEKEQDMHLLYIMKIPVHISSKMQYISENLLDASNKNNIKIREGKYFGFFKLMNNVQLKIEIKEFQERLKVSNMLLWDNCNCASQSKTTSNHINHANITTQHLLTYYL